MCSDDLRRLQVATILAVWSRSFFIGDGADSTRRDARRRERGGRFCLFQARLPQAHDHSPVRDPHRLLNHSEERHYRSAFVESLHWRQTALARNGLRVFPRKKAAPHPTNWVLPAL